MRVKKLREAAYMLDVLDYLSVLTPIVRGLAGSRPYTNRYVIVI